MEYTITQRKPDTSQDESSYSTAIKINIETYPIVGYGHSQGEADSNALKALIAYVK